MPSRTGKMRSNSDKKLGKETLLGVWKILSGQKRSSFVLPEDENGDARGNP